MTLEQARKLYVQAIKNRTGARNADGSVPAAVDDATFKKAEQMLLDSGDLLDPSLPQEYRENVGLRRTAQNRADRTGQTVAYADSDGEVHQVQPTAQQEENRRTRQQSRRGRQAQAQADRGGREYRGWSTTATTRGQGTEGDVIGGAVDNAEDRPLDSPEGLAGVKAAATVTSDAVTFNTDDPAEVGIKEAFEEDLAKQQQALVKAWQRGDAKAVRRTMRRIRRMVASTNHHLQKRRENQTQRSGRDVRGAQSHLTGAIERGNEQIAEAQEQLTAAQEAGDTETVEKLTGDIQAIQRRQGMWQKELDYMGENGRTLTADQRKGLWANGEIPQAVSTADLQGHRQRQEERRNRRRQRDPLRTVNTLAQQTNLTGAQIAAIQMGLPMPPSDGTQRHKPGEIWTLEDRTPKAPGPEPDAPEGAPETPESEVPFEDRFDTRIDDYDTHKEEIDKNMENETFKGVADAIDNGEEITDEQMEGLDDRQKFLLERYRQYREAMNEMPETDRTVGNFDTRVQDYETHKDEIAENMSNEAFGNAAASVDRGERITKEDWDNLSDRQRFLMQRYKFYREVVKAEPKDGSGPKRLAYVPKGAKIPIQYDPDYKPSKAFKATADALAANRPIDYAAYVGMTDYEKNLLANWYRQVNPDLFKDK
jgi:hypothetical protein